MTRETLWNSLDRMTPDEESVSRIWDTILHSGATAPKKAKKGVQKWIAAAALFCILVGGALYLGNAAGLLPTPSSESSFTSNSSCAETAQVTDEFVWDGKTYCAVSNSLDWNLPATVSSQEAGPQLDVIQSSADASLIGCPIFEYAPLSCDAVLIVQRDSRYEVFTFFTFQAYEQNSDVDAQEYLSLYGIQDTGDIEKVELLTPEGSLLHTFATPEEIQQFYGEYAALKNSSEEYFAALGITHSPSEPGDSILYMIADSTTPQDLDHDADTQTSPSRPGTNALANSIQIRIHAVNGLYYDTPYYPNIQFLSRYRVSDSFAAMLELYLPS